VNCSQHIAPRFTPEEIAEAARELRARIAALEAENRELREAVSRAQRSA
jgi:outer membrane murein-binding lipoprotein Lpp